MEGNLLKWTNYWMGWQPRYFVLKDGILCYYNNETDIANGAKRSFKIFMFDIIVSKSDNTRIDLIVANDQHLYIKACDYKERQKWLVALASQKATHSTKTVSGSSTSSLTNVSIPYTSDQVLNQSLDESQSSISAKCLNNLFQPNLTPLDRTNMLKLKQSELRLYCDLLSQQTHELKNLVNTTYTPNFKNSESTTTVVETGIEILNNPQNSPKETLNSAASSFKSAENNSSENFSSEQNTSESDTIKKMDDITSSMNITCDMVIQIIRNLIVLSNTSSNVSPGALASLLEDANQLNISQSSSNLGGSLSANRSPEHIVDNLTQYHLYHPMHTNNQLTQQFRSNSSSDAFDFGQTSNNEKLTTESDLVLMVSSKSLNTDTRSLFSLPLNRSKNFNSSLKGAKTTHLFANNTSSTTNNSPSHNNARRRTRNLPTLHNLNPLKHTNNSLISPNSTKSEFLFSTNLLSMGTTMAISNYSIKDSLKETSITGNKSSSATDDLPGAIPPVIDSNCDTIISDLNEKMKKGEKKANTVASLSVTTASAPYPSLTVYAETTTSIRSKTFFSQKKHCFTQLELTENKGIPTEYFLGCCTDIFSLFDNFGSSAFLPVKVDIYGNINKLKQKYSSDTKRYHTLQAIVHAEIDDNVTTVKNSATDALMWLKRAIWFLKEFLREFSSKEKPDLTECVYQSYQISLRQYHNWVVRSIFSIAVRSLPTTESFLQGLANDPQIFLDDKQEFERQIKEEMKNVYFGVDACLNLINEMYAENRLEK